jgi:hypothetical protein
VLVHPFDDSSIAAQAALGMVYEPDVRSDLWPIPANRFGYARPHMDALSRRSESGSASGRITFSACLGDANENREEAT